MYATIRRYPAKDPSATRTMFTELKQRIEGRFLPTLQEIPGFHGYYVLNANDRELVTVSIFDDRAGAQESTRRAAEFVRNDPVRDLLRSPEVIEGELMIGKEVPAGSH